MKSRKFNRTLLVGPTGSGKTTLVKNILRERNNGSEFIFVADTNRLYPCQKRFDSSEEMIDFFEREENPGVYCADFGTEEEDQEEWEVFFEIADSLSGLSEKRKNRPVTLVVDELIEFSTSVKNNKYLERFVRYSRFAEIDVYYNTMRPRGVQALIPINCNRLVVFRQNRRVDLKAVMDFSSLSDADFFKIRKLEQFTWTKEAPLPVRGRHYLIFPENAVNPKKAVPVV